MSPPTPANNAVIIFIALICFFTSQCNQKSDRPLENAAESQERIDMTGGDSLSEENSLFIAATKGDPDSCYRLAVRVWSSNLDFRKFGATKEKAKIQLLEQALNRKHEAIIPLASIYRYSKENKDPVKARELLKRSAMMHNSTSCFDYADMCYSGEGGGQNLEDAYFFVSASVLTCDPRSFTGEEGWKLRDNAAALMNKDKLREISKHVHEWIDASGSPKLMPGTSPDPKEEYEAAQLIKTMDAAHNSKFKITE